MMRALARFLRDRRGVAAIEAALILPVVLVMIAGIIEYGRVLIGQHMIRDIVDESARTAAVTGQTQAQVTSAVDGLVATVPALDSYTVSATLTGSAVTVTVTGSFNSFFGDLLPDTVLDFTISSVYPL